VLARALLPAAALGDWLRDEGAVTLDGVSVLRAADQQEEAAAIALVLRQAIVTPGRRAALVTPDRGLAGRVAVELARWGVVADDSAGEPLHATPPAVFHRLLARAASGGLSPVALLSLLKHPLAACGLAPGACRASARLLERALLRGPAPRPGFAGLRDRLAAARDDAHGALADRPDAPEDLAGFVDRLERCLAPVLGFGAAESRPVGDLLTGLIAAAEALAATDEKSGADRLWAVRTATRWGSIWRGWWRSATCCRRSRVGAGRGADRFDGRAVRALAARIAGAERECAASAHLYLGPDGSAVAVGRDHGAGWAGGRRVAAGDRSGAVDESADAGAGRPAFARSGRSDRRRMISWPAAVRRRRLCCRCPVGGTGRRPCRRGGWCGWMRFSPGGGRRCRRIRPWRGWDGWTGRWRRRARWRRRPCPPVDWRPRRLTITEIETWMRDPYAIHARHILGLRRLKEIEEPADAADYGTIVHAALDRWCRQPVGERADEAGLRALFAEALAEARLRPALAAWWAPRLERIASWVIATEAARAAGEGAPIVLTRTEQSGRATLNDLPGGPFLLRGRADRIDRDAAGRWC
jgi:ATP-dependent helicase/nuclease subunit B